MMNSIKSKSLRAIKYLLSRPKLDYLWLAILSLYIFFVWFEGNAPYFGGDIIYPLNPSLNIDRILYTWTDNNGGLIQSGMIYYFFSGFFFLADKLGLSVGVAERIYLYINFILPGLGMYYLTSVVYSKMQPNGSGKRVACWMAALFYIFCPALLKMPQVYWFYGVFPFILVFFIKTIDAPNLKGKVKFGLLASLFCFGLFLFFPNAQMAVILVLILVLYSLLYLFFNRHSAKRVLGSWLVLGAVVILINLAVILPFVIMVLTQGQTVLTQTPIDFLGKWLDEAPYAMLRNLSGGIHSLGPEGQRYLPFGFYFGSSPVMYFVNLLLTVAAFGALIFRPKTKNALFFVFYFALIAIVGIIIATGPNPPFGVVWKWLLEHALILRIFRTTGQVATIIALGYAVLIGVTISEIFQRVRKTYQKVEDRLSKSKQTIFQHAIPMGMVFMMIVLILTNGWPMVTGAFYKTPEQWPNNQPIEVPASYYQLDGWLNEQAGSKDYHLLTLPFSGYMQTTWPPRGYFGSNVAPYIFSDPVIFATAGREGIMSPVLGAMQKASESDLNLMAKLAGLSNVKYFYVDGYSVAASNIPSPSTATHRGPSIPSYAYEQNFEKLSLFSIGDEWVFPRVYATSRVELINGSIDPDLLNYLKNADFSAGKPVLFAEDQLSLERWQFLQGFSTSGNSPQIAFEQINSTRYIVHVENASGPFFLVLSTQFTDFWKARIDGGEVSQHLMANGYANVWYIDKTGSFDVVLNYQVQTYYHIALVISGLTFVVALCHVGSDFFRKGGNSTARMVKAARLLVKRNRRRKP